MKGDWRERLKFDVPRGNKKPFGSNRNVQDIERRIRHSMELVFPCGYSNGRTRGHSRKLAKDNFRLDVRKYFFSQRIVKRWNSLSEELSDLSGLSA